MAISFTGGKGRSTYGSSLPSPGTVNVTIPTGTLIGDFLVYTFEISPDWDVTITSPGWTVSSDPHILTKIATAASGADTFTLTWAGGGLITYVVNTIAIQNAAALKVIIKSGQAYSNPPLPTFNIADIKAGDFLVYSLMLCSATSYSYSAAIANSYTLYGDTVVSSNWVRGVVGYYTAVSDGDTGTIPVANASINHSKVNYGFIAISIQAANVTAVPAVSTSDFAIPVTGIGYSTYSVPAISTSDNALASLTAANTITPPSAISTGSVGNIADSVAWTVDVIPASSTSDGAPVSLYWNGLAVVAAIATAVIKPPVVPLPVTPSNPIYTQAQYRAKFFEPTTIITRRIEILNADGVTLWDDQHGNPKRLISGSVSVDYTRDERRSIDLVLSNFDNALIHQPGGFWYDKIIRIWRGIKFYDITGLHDYEVSLGEFMIDRVQEGNTPKQVTITARDYTKKCLLSRFTQATSFASGTAIETVINILAANAGISKRLVPVTGKALGKDYMYERGVSRWEAMKDIASAFGYELFFDGSGYLVMRNYLDPTLSPVSHTFQTGKVVGNLVSWEKSADDTRIYNHIAVTGGDPNSTPVFAEAVNTNPSSPTRVALIGDRLYEFVSSFITTVQQAQDVADKFLKIHALEEYEISINTIVAPWLEAGEIAQFIDPDAPVTDPTRFLMTAYTIPLGLEPMSATGRRVTIVG